MKRSNFIILTLLVLSLSFFTFTITIYSGTRNKQNEADKKSESAIYVLKEREQIKIGTLVIRFERMEFETLDEEIQSTDRGIVIYLKLRSAENKTTLIFTDSDQKQQKWQTFMITLIHIDDVNHKITFKIDKDLSQKIIFFLNPDS